MQQFAFWFVPNFSIACPVLPFAEILCLFMRDIPRN